MKYELDDLLRACKQKKEGGKKIKHTHTYINCIMCASDHPLSVKQAGLGYVWKYTIMFNARNETYSNPRVN